LTRPRIAAKNGKNAGKTAADGKILHTGGKKKRVGERFGLNNFE